MTTNTEIQVRSKRPTGRIRSASQKALIKRLRLTFKLLALSPRHAGAFAEKLFTTPRRHARPAWEQEIKNAGTPFDLFVSGGRVSGGRVSSGRVSGGGVSGGRLLPALAWGEGPTVALMHGWEGRGTQLGAFVQPLVQQGFRVVAVDAAGHGDAPDGRASPTEFADLLLSLAAAEGGLHGVIAHSLGALGVAFAFHRGLTAKRVALVAPANSPRMATEMMGRLLSMPPDVVSDLQARLERDANLSLDEIEEGRIFSHIDCPVLVVHDLDDNDVSADAAEAISAATGARVRWTQGLGHRRILRDAAVVKRVAAFIADAPKAKRDGWQRFLYDDHAPLL